MNEEPPVMAGDRPLAKMPVPAGVSAVLAATILSIGLVMHAIFPRYEFSRGDAGDGIVVFVFDTWTGAFQRVDYSATGEPNATPVVRPF
jgi:hypothetical protein